MCTHDHDNEPVVPPAAVSRRGVLGAAALLAGVGAASVTGAGAAAAEPGRSPGRYRGTAPRPAPLVLEGGPLLDPATGEVTEDAVVVLRDGEVLAAGSRNAVRRALAEVGDTATRIDVQGAWLLPGLVDVHVHVNALADASGVLQAGATTVRSGSSSFYQDIALRSLPEWAPGTAPRMRAAGLFVSPQLGDSVLADPALAPLAALPDGVREVSDLRYLTRVNVSRGVDVVKTRANPRAGLAEQDPLELVYDAEQLSAVVSEAAKGGAHVLCHAYSAEGCDGAVRAGVRSLEHGVFVSEGTLATMARRRTAFTPTLAAIQGMIGSADPVLDRRGREYFPVLQAAVRAAHAMGVPVVAGTDTFGTSTTPVGGEIRRLTEAGVPALDALRGATTTAAWLLGMADRVGRLRRGYAADVIAVDGDPLADPSACERVRLVVAQGVVARDEVSA